MRRLSHILVIPFLFLTGCPSTQTAPPAISSGARPIVLLLQQQDDSLQGQKFRTLLDFEHDSDLVFVKTDGQTNIDSATHTGNGAMKLLGTSATVRVSSVLFSTKLPGDWTLLGFYVRPEVDTPVYGTLLEGGTQLAQARQIAPAGRWTFVAIDLTDPKLADPLTNANLLTLRIDLPNVGALATTNIDDVLLVDNATTLLDTLETGPGGWKISRSGFKTTIDAPGRFTIQTTAAAASDKGWVLAEQGSIRAILKSAGPVKNWVVYNDGRWIEDGKMSVKGASGEAAIASHQSPGDVAVDEAGGKLDLYTEGDADNDGYNEQRGAYQIVARSARVQIKLTPSASPVASPVLEIVGLPPGNVTATVEGLLVDQSSRLPDGRVLLNLPLRLERPTQITVRTATDNSK